MHSDESEMRPGRWTRPEGAGMSRPQVRASVVAVLLLLAAGLYTLKDFLPALVWGGIVAIAVWPPFRRAARRWPRHRRTLLPGAVVALVLLVFVVPVAMVAVPVAEDARAAAAWVEQARQEGIAPPQFLARLPYGPRLETLWRQQLGAPQDVSALAGRAMQRSGGVQTGRRIGAEAVHRLVLLGFMLLALFFLLRDAEVVALQLRIAGRRIFGAAGEDVSAQVVRSIHGTVDGLVLVGLGEGVVLGLAYWAAGVPHPALFGLLTGVLAMVPFGAALAFLVAGAVLLAQGSLVAAAVIVALGFAVSFVADHFLRPALIGGATRLPFLWVLLGILGGVEAWGLVGLFLGPALMAALMLVWREWVGAQRGPINPSAAETAEALPAR